MRVPKLSSSRPQIRWICEVFRGERALYALVTVMDCVSAVMYVLYAFLMRNLIDGAVAGDGAALVRNGMYLLALVLSRIALTLSSRRLTLVIQKKWEIKARTRVLDSLLHKNEGALREYHSGALHDRLFSDVYAVAEAAVNMVPDFASMIAGLAAALLSLYWIERVLPLVIIACGLLFIAVRRLFGAKIKAYYLSVRNRNAERSAYYQEILENLLILKVFRAENAARARGEYYEKRSYLAWRIGYRYKQLTSGGVTAFFSLGELAAAVFASALVMRARLTYGSMTALLQLVAQVQAPFSEIFSEVSAFSAMVASAERLMELEALPEEDRQEALDARALYANMRAIRLCDVTFSYREGAPILRGASAEIHKGDFILIAGESGIGKSTLLKLILNVLAPEAGGAYIECQNGERVALDNAARALFAYVPQGNMLFSGTIRDNLTFLCGERDDEDIWRALEAACADQFVREREGGLDSVLTENAGGLSEGQAQRLAIARALLCEAPVLLLDEATSALDGETEKRILRRLRERKDTTLLIISHRDAARDICDAQWRIRDGRIEERRLREP